MKITISTDEHIYTGMLQCRDYDGILIEESGKKVFVPWDEIQWIGKEMKEDEKAAKFIKRYKLTNWAVVISIIAVGIAAILVRRWLF